MSLFAAIPLPDRISADLERIQKGVSGARWVPREKMHITVGFFGDVTDDFAEILDTELGRVPLPAFELQLSGIGHFGSNPPASLWAGIDTITTTAASDQNAIDPLTRLHHHVKKCARKAKIEMERRTFRPHVTLAYLSPHTPTERIIAFKTAHARLKSARFLVDRFALYSSQSHRTGPNTYQVEARYPLLAPTGISQSK